MSQHLYEKIFSFMVHIIFESDFFIVVGDISFLGLGIVANYQGIYYIILLAHVYLIPEMFPK